MADVSWFGFVSMVVFEAVYCDIVVNTTQQFASRSSFWGILEKRSWVEASEACRVRGYIDLADNGLPGYITIRHELLERGWPKDENVWVGLIKYNSHTPWIRASKCTIRNLNVNSTSGARQCLLLDMSRDSGNANVYPSDCSEHHYYVCYKREGPFLVDSFYNVTINVQPSIGFASLGSMTEHECYQRLTYFINAQIVIYTLDNVCTRYSANALDSPYTVTLRDSDTANNVVFLTTVQLNVQIISTIVNIPADNYVYPCPEYYIDTISTMKEIIPTTEFVATTKSILTTDSGTTTGNVVTTDSGTTTESVVTTEFVATTESVVTADSGTTTESVVFTTDSGTTTESVVTTDNGTTTESVVTTDSGTTTESVVFTTDSGTTTESVVTTDSGTTMVTYQEMSSQSTNTNTMMSQATSLCHCTCEDTHITKLEEWILKMRLKLIIKKHLLSSFQRKLTSQYDDRTSSKVIGAGAAVIVITVLLAVPLLSDVISVIVSLIRVYEIRQSLKYKR